MSFKTVQNHFFSKFQQLRDISGLFGDYDTKTERTNSYSHNQSCNEVFGFPLRLKFLALNQFLP